MRRRRVALTWGGVLVLLALLVGLGQGGAAQAQLAGNATASQATQARTATPTQQIAKPYRAMYRKAMGMAKMRITAADREAAAQRALRKLAMAGKLDGVQPQRLAAGRGLPAAPQAAAALAPPDYFGMTPNYANSQLPSGAPVVTIADPPAGAGNAAALATATVDATGAISGFTLLFGGAGYAAPPAAAPLVTITGSGSGATASATVGANGTVTSLTLLTGGSGYLSGVTGGIRKFVDTLPGLGSTAANDLGQYIPVAVADTTSYPGSDYYEIAVVQYSEKMHADLTPTTLRGYVQIDPSQAAGTPGSNHIALSYPGTGGPITDVNGNQVYAYDNPQYLGPTILAHRGRPVRVKFDNYLPAGASGDLFLPVDTTIMGAGDGPDANPAGGMFQYQSNRATLHLHGGITPWISDGTPHQWTVPVHDTAAHYKKGVSTQNVPDMPVPGQGSMTFFYTNQQSARLMFYHDHAYGITRLNVYAGEAAGYLLDDPVEQTLVTGGTIGTTTIAANTVPADQIPLVIQDKTFVPGAAQLTAEDPTWDSANWGGQGNLWFPHVYMPNQNPYDPSGANMMGRWDYGPWFWPPYTGLINGPVANPLSGSTPQEGPLNPGTPNPSLVPEGFMDTPLVNGAAYPVLNVDPKAYRLRILNASNDRFWNLQLYQAASQNPMWNTDANGHATTLNDAAAGEVAMVPAVQGSAGTAGYPKDITDGRDGGVPDVRSQGPAMVQIGTEGGLLPQAVDLPDSPIGYTYNRRDIVVLNVSQKNLFLGPAERADVIVDFSQYAGKTLIMYNDGPAPVPAFDPRNDYYSGDPDNTLTGGAPSTLPGYGPNTRTIMMIKVSGTANGTAFDEAALKAALPLAYGASLDKPIVPETAYNAAFPGTATHDNYSRIADTSLWTGGGVTGFKVLTAGTGYATAPAVAITGGGGSGATAHAVVAGGAVTDVVLDTAGTGFTTAPVVTLLGGGGSGASVTAIGWHVMEPKAIQELFTVDYGRMNATLGVELPFTTVTIQTTIPYGYAEPVTEKISNTADLATPVGSLGDGTQIWKITHNGVDTHAIHFHLFNVQVINRVGWDGAIRPPDPNELGWKDTVRMNPLEDCIVALRPTAPKEPWGQPDSIRPIDPTMPTSMMIQTIDPTTGQAISVPNTPVNFGWEYVWHCHLLGHEENDMMRPIEFDVARTLATAPVLTGNWPQNGTSATLSWTDATPWNGTGPASTLGNPANEIGFRVERAAIGSNGQPGAYAVIGTALANTTSYVDASVVAGKAYSYRVVAYNAAGDSRSNAVTLSNLAVPAAPSGLNFTIARTAAGPDTVTLSWTDNATNETGFTIQRATNAAFTAGLTILTRAANVTSTTNTVAHGATYHYRIRAINPSAVSTWSNTITVTTVPFSPSNFRSNGRTATSIALAWTDRSSNETGYQIQRRRVGGTFATVWTTGANATSWNNTGLARGTTYQFRIRGINGVGNSPWAATITVSTLP
jgi:FtsP/CotA-like multicopper oxidase with cupredoxin domain